MNLSIKKLIFFLLLGLSFSNLVQAREIVFTAIGDQPYFSEASFEALIQKINTRHQSQFTIHVGDIKSGATICSDERYISIKKLFDTFQRALIYTPGDNEWTDCHRASNGSYEPTERLRKIREIFFPTKQSLGQQPISLLRQGDTSKTHSSYIENSRWIVNDLLFVTLHQVGSNNNLDRKIPGAFLEYQERNQANIAWLHEAFNFAMKHKTSGIVLAMQADTFDPRTPEESGFTEFHQEFAQLAKKYKKPILVIQGDSHQYKIDQAFKDSRQQTLKNVLRLIVPGASSVEAVQVNFNPNETDIHKVFIFEKY